MLRKALPNHGFGVKGKIERGKASRESGSFLFLQPVQRVASGCDGEKTHKY